MEQPSVAILLAVYNPQILWLEQLLDSLDAQTYQNIHIYVRNDASSSLSREDLEILVGRRINHFPFTVLHNEVNLGSNKTFETLISDCHEELICFCDQDDIWLPKKVENTVLLFLQSPLSPKLVCTDVKVINGDGKTVAPDMEHHRKRHVFLRGENLAPTLIYRNFVMGCTMLMRREDALSYLPIPDAVVHDHYLAFRAALDGALDYLPEPQMLYRVYGSNQTGVMTGVKNKSDYEKRRITVFAKRLEAFRAGAHLPEYKQAVLWYEARKSNWNREKGGFTALRKCKDVNKPTSLFEMFARFLPAPLFRFAIFLVQKRVI